MSIFKSLKITTCTLLLLGFFPTSHILGTYNDKVLINELLFDPEGTDLGHEWIELYNPNDTEIDISDWKIQAAGTTFKDVYKFPLGTKIYPGQYFLLCEEVELPNCQLYLPKLGFQNGGGATDGVRLVRKDGTVDDTILYDSPNANGLPDESGSSAADSTTASLTQSGKSLGRASETDTDNSSVDFIQQYMTSPGQANLIADFKDNLEFSEIYVSQSPEASFIELLSQSGENIDTTNWYIKRSETSTEKYPLPDLSNSFILLNKNNLTGAIESESCYFLYSPDEELRDKICLNKQSYAGYSLCYLNGSEDLSQCQPTPNAVNLSFQYNVSSLEQIVQRKPTYSNATFCMPYQLWTQTFIAQDTSRATRIRCDECSVNQCYMANLQYKDSGLEVIEILSSENISDLEPSAKVIMSSLQQDDEYNFISLNTTYLKLSGKYQYFDFLGATIRTNSLDPKLKPKQPVNLTGYLREYSRSSDGTPKYELILASMTNSTIQTLAATGMPIYPTIILSIALALFFLGILLHFKTFK